MKEFFMNIINWFSINKDAIFAFFTSSTFASFVAAIVLVIRQTKASKDNTSATNILNKSIEANNSLNAVMNSVGVDTKEILFAYGEMHKQLLSAMDDIENFKDAVFGKINAMMDVQAIVYATIKDEKTRMNVMNILSNAKLLENKTREELEAKVENLRDALTEKVEDVKKLADDALEEVRRTISTDNTDDTDIVRY